MQHSALCVGGLVNKRIPLKYYKYFKKSYCPIQKPLQINTTIIIWRDEVDGLQSVMRAVSTGFKPNNTTSQALKPPLLQTQSPTNKEKMNVEISGFNELPSLSHSKAVSRLIQLSPSKGDTVYSVVYDVVVTHGRKVITVRSPLKVWWLFV